MMEFAGNRGCRVEHDWTATAFAKLPEKAGVYLDVVVLGRNIVWSENRFGRRVGAKDASTVPAVLETDVLLCERAENGRPFRLAVRGAGLVSALCRHVQGIDWPRGGCQPDEHPAPVMFDIPVLISIRCSGTRKADVGEYFAYSVGTIMCDDVHAFVREYREKCAGFDTPQPETDDEIPF